MMSEGWFGWGEEEEDEDEEKEDLEVKLAQLKAYALSRQRFKYGDR